MAFGLKYELYCKTRKNRLFKAKVYFDGYEGSQIDRNVPVSPFKLRKDKAAIVRGTSFEFSIREEVDFEFMEFYTNSNKKVKVELYDPSDTLIWVGYNLPQQYQVPYVPSPVNVTFTATDGLGLLKNELFTLTGLNSQLTIIRHCIDKIGLSLGYSIAINLFETTHNHSYTPLAQTYEESEIFAGLNCYEVLEAILKKYNAEITQRRGRWAITRAADKKSTRMLYTSAGVYETTEAAPAVLDLGYPGAGIEVSPRGSLNMSLESGGKKVKIRHDFGRKTSLLINPDFSEFATGVFSGWGQVGSFTAEQLYNDNGPYAFIPGIDNASSCLYQAFDIENAPGEDFVFSVDMGAIGYRLYGGIPIPIPINVQMVIALTDGVDTKYLAKTGLYPNYAAEWVDELTSIDMEVASQIGGTPRMNRLSLITQEIPFSGSLQVTLYRIQGTPAYQYTYTGVAFGNVDLTFVVNGGPYPSAIETEASFTNSSEPLDLPDIDLLTADAPDYVNAALLYFNITRLSNGSATTLWHILGSAVERSILQHLAYDLASLNRIARQKLTGEIKGTGIAFDSIIKHTYNNNREYEIAEGIWDIYEEVFSVTLIELLAWSDESVTFVSVETISTGSPATGGSSGSQVIMGGAEILDALLTVDGSGSALDADLLDGNHGSYYAPIASPSFTGTVTLPVDQYIVATGGYNMFRRTAATHFLFSGATDLQINNNIDTATLIVITNGGSLGVGVSPSYFVHVKKDQAAATELYVENLTNNAAAKAELHLSTLGGNVNLSCDRTNGDFTISGGSGITRLGELVVGSDIGSPSFSSGYAGSGWKNDETSGEYTLTVDKLVVRKALTAYDLDINKINSINGGIVISVACGICLTVSGTTIYMDEDGGSKLIQFAVDDYIRAQIWTGRGIASYIGKVTAVHHDNTYGSAYITATTISGTPWNGMELVQIGNSGDSARQNLIYITASDTNNPYIDMLAGVTAGSFAGKQKLRIGNLTGITDAVFGALSGYGLWSDNAYLSGSLFLPTAGITNEGSSASSIRIYAGDTYANRATAPFKVTQDGSLTATGVVELGTKPSTVDGLTQNLAIKNTDIYEPAYNGDSSGIKINRIGHNGTTDHYRDFVVYDGKENKVFQINGGATTGIYFGTAGNPVTVGIDGSLEVSGQIDFGGNHVEATGTSNITCAASEGDMDDMSISFTPKGSKVLITFCASFYVSSNNQTLWLIINVGGGNVRTMRSYIIGGYQPHALTHIASVTPGSAVTIKMRWSGSTAIQQRGSDDGYRVMTITDLH